ncbi:MAG TPA: ribosome maturation factor RimP [Gammaproteobacteria bacterium]|nr:ribosome maturation factor RimP [Gammaproteobacteria bacterium]
MGELNSQLEQTLRKGIEALGYELVCVEYLQRRQSLLRLYLDSPDGIGVDDCEQVSRYVSGVLDVDDPLAGSYTLEVSSPGADRPLVTADHFRRFAGEEAKVQLRHAIDGRKNFRGRILDVDGGELFLVVDGTELHLPLVAIRKARLVPSFAESELH